MASTQIDNILKIYKQLAQNRSLTLARLFFPKNLISVQSFWSQNNLERRQKQKFVQEFSLDLNLKPLVEGHPSDISSELLTAFSKNDELRAILREVTLEGKSKQFIEIWDQYHLIKSYDLSALDVHGEVYSDVTFRGLQWSPDGAKLLYVAEKKLPKTEPFYKQRSNSKNSKTDDEILKGTEYVYKPDWGEQLVGKHRSVVVVLNINEDTIVPLDSIPDDYFPAQAIWAPNGEDIVGVAYKIKTRYLGLHFCTNRESYIFHLKSGEFSKLTKEGLACRSPRFDPNGKYLVWLERNLSVPHHHVHRLMYMKWDVSGSQPDILVDVVKKCTIINKDKKFYGIYNQNLAERCWSDDSIHLFFSSVQRSSIKSYFVNLETKLLTEINNDDSSLSILDVKKNYIAFSRSSLILPSQLIIGKFDPTSFNIDDFHLRFITVPLKILNSETLTYDVTEYFHENNDSTNDFNFIYFGKKEGTEKSVPLIASAHGGPHSVYSNEFDPSMAVFAVLGFGVLKINYRGSIGFGGDNVEYILGKVGESDVLDCVTAINVSLKKYSWLNPKKVCLYGGSHGGFLNAHLSGQHPDMFKAVVMRNPVIDLAAMFTISDIPDWCPGEAGSSLGKLPETTPKSNYSDLMQVMLKHSPILHADSVKAPTLLALGSNDLRVPMSQGKLWYYRLKANNVKAKLYIYEDNHSLLKNEVAIDFLINSALWFLENTSDR